MASPELACVYAALILNDDKIDITSDKIISILNSANVKIESYWIDLFVQYFKNHDISELIKGTNLGNVETSKSDSPTKEGTNTSSEKKEEDNNNKEEEEVEMGGFDDLFG